VLALARKGFSLVELTAVIVVLVILCAIVVLSVGDVRSGAFSASSARLEREFSRGVETLVAAGDSVNGDLQTLVTANPALQGPVNVSDPSCMGLDTVTWHLSTVSSPTATLLNQVLSTLNSHLAAQGDGAVLIPDSSQLSAMLAQLNADAILAYNGTQLQTVLLHFYPP
jgi:type II secretory pathway pseudopilin PulG